MRGEAKSEERPNIAYLSFGVVNEAPTAEQAAADNAAPSAAAIDAAKAMGVDPKDIQSQSFSVFPVYVEEHEAGPRQPTRQKVAGYQGKSPVSAAAARRGQGRSGGRQASRQGRQ